MSQILELVVLVFATVGLVAFGRWIFRSGWGPIWMVVGVLATISLWWAMVNGPLRGRFGADHGILTDLVATFGIVIAARWGFRQVGNNWQRQTAVVIGAFVLLLIMWVPRHQSGELALPSDVSLPGSETAEETGPTISSEPPRSAPSHTHSGTLSCDDLSYEGRQAAGCP